MKNILKKLLLMSVLGVSLLGLTGCDEVQIFKKKLPADRLIALSDDEIRNDIYYTKNNTKFYETYVPNGGNLSSVIPSSLIESRVGCVCNMENKIPPLYKDEVIAFASDENSIKSVTIERYKNLGYSIACFGGVITQDGYLQIDRESNVVEDSSLSKVLENVKSDNIRIVSFNDKELTNADIDIQSGTIIGLEKYEEYKIGYFAGTKYKEDIVKADTMILKAYELYVYDDNPVEDTPNGYSCFTMEQGLENGYYRINDGGIFRYYNHERGENDDVDMNISHYKTDYEKIAAYSRQYTVNVPQRVKDMKIVAEYSYHYTRTKSNKNKDLEQEQDVIQGYVFSPDKTQYKMLNNAGDGKLILDLAEAMAGEWTVNIIPKTLEVKDFKVESSKAEEAPTLYEKDFVFGEDGQENVVFSAEYTNGDKAEVFGIILSPSGRSYNLEKWTTGKYSNKDERYFIGYSLPYAEEGTYTMRIYYHPEDTTINEPKITDNTEKDTEVIIIDG